MFLPFDTPLAGKKTLHRRSKTITVLVNQQKKNSILIKNKKSLSSQKNYKSTQIFKNQTQPVSENEDDKHFLSLRKMTQQIQRLINRELQYPQLLTHVQRGTSRLTTKQNQNPQHNEFNQNSYIQKNKHNLESYTAGFRQPEYLTLLKKTQRLNPKSFIPHFNWKQKLTRLKNMGNYGNVFKKKGQRPSQKKFQQKMTKQDNRYYVIDSTKITIDPQIIISRGVHQQKYHRKGSTCRRCHTSCTDYTQQQQKKYNKTCLYGQRLYSRNQSQNKRNNNDKLSRHGKLSERDWKFQPWDVKKDNY